MKSDRSDFTNADGSEPDEPIARALAVPTDAPAFDQCEAAAALLRVARGSGSPVIVGSLVDAFLAHWDAFTAARAATPSAEPADLVATIDALYRTWTSSDEAEGAPSARRTLLAIGEVLEGRAAS